MIVRRVTTGASLFALAIMTACVVPGQPQRSARSRDAERAFRGESPPAPTFVSSATPIATASVAPKKQVKLFAVSARDLEEVRPLIFGEYDRVVLDPKLVDATDNVFTAALRRSEAVLETHAAKHDLDDAIALIPPCESEFLAILEDGATAPIRQDEDDVQYKRRTTAYAASVAHFRNAMDSTTDATREDLVSGYRILFTRAGADGQPVQKSPLLAKLEAVKERDSCVSKLVLVASQWWKRERSVLDARRQADVKAKDAEARKAVLARRFAPVKGQCGSSWQTTSTMCAELPGLSDDERVQCNEECRLAANEGVRVAFGNALASCVMEFEKGGLRECEVSKPKGATIADADIAKNVADCKTNCPLKVREEKARIAKEHQDCLDFCRDLKSGFCAFTDKPKQVCIGRCIQVKCSP
jgi:hypothetical protein